MKNPLLFMLILIFAICPLSSFSVTINIPGDQPTIQDGINNAEHGDTVLVSPGVYTESIDFLGKNIKVFSSDGYNSTYIIAPSADVIAISMTNAESPEAELNGFNIIGGDNTYTVFLDNDASPVIKNNIFSGHIPNNSSKPNVIYCQSGYPLITRNIFKDNGGGHCIFIALNARHTMIINNTFYNNNSWIGNSTRRGVVLNNIFLNTNDLSGTGGFNVYGYNIVWNDSWDDKTAAEFGYIDKNSSLPNYSLDPMLDVTTFQLLPNSPCIDVGSPESAYNDPDGTRNDLGAHYHYRELPFADSINYGELEYPDIIPSLSPIFYWSFFDTTGFEQSELHIQIGTDNDWTSAEMWDWGPINSSDTEIVYDGSPLDERTLYYIRVRVSNGLNWGNWQWNSFYVRSGKLINVPVKQPTIQSAIDWALDGDSIIVDPGTYAVNLNYSGKSIKILAKDCAENTILNPADSSLPMVLITNGESDYTELSGFTISHSGNDDHCIIIDNEAAPVIQNNIFHHNMTESYSDRYVIANYDAPTLITRNLFYRNGGTCVRILSEGANARVINNTFYKGHIAVGGFLDNAYVTNNSMSGFYCGIFAFVITEYNNSWNNFLNFLYGEPDPTDISIDPNYLDTLNNDYSLALGSPLINAGNPDPLYNDPDGTRSDIGAIPFFLTDPDTDTLFILQGYSYPDTTFTVLLGGNISPDFTHLNIDIEAFIINESVIPIDVSFAAHENFEDEIIKIDMNRGELIRTFGAVWEDVIQPFSISGQSQNGECFQKTAYVYFIGHKKGDANADNVVNALDILYLIDHIYYEGPDPKPELEFGDINEDGNINLLDVLELIKSLYN